MKRFLLILLLGCFNLQAQNNDYLNKINKLDSLEVIQFAKDLIALNNEGFKIYDDKENFKYFTRVIRMYPSKYTLEEFENKYKNIGVYNCNECLKLSFSVYYEGKNEDLKLAGTKFYQFKEAQGDYLMLYPFWNKYIVNDVSQEDLLKSENSNKRWYKFPEDKLNIRFWKQDNWTIINYK